MMQQFSSVNQSVLSKRIAASKDFGKSISLNWWCDPPPEFLDSTYDFRTEVYFVGTLFEQLISRYDIEHFKYSDLLRRMCAKDPTQRLPSFSEAEREVQNDRFDEIDFSDHELNWYRAFADEVTEHITKIKRGTKYVDDLDRLRSDLDAVYRKCMLEQYVPDARTVLSCVLTGDYYYRQSGFEVESLKGFIRLLKSVTNEKRRIIGANLHTRLDAIPRYDAREDSKDDFDDIPF